MFLFFVQKKKEKHRERNQHIFDRTVTRILAYACSSVLFFHYIHFVTLLSERKIKTNKQLWPAIDLGIQIYSFGLYNAQCAVCTANTLRLCALCDGFLVSDNVKFTHEEKATNTIRKTFCDVSQLNMHFRRSQFEFVFLYDSYE